MKKALLFVIVFGASIMVFAQTEKGTFLAGGQSSILITSLKESSKTTVNKTDGDKTFKIEALPQVGYFIANGLALGLEVPFTFEKGFASRTTGYSTLISVAPFVRYYIGNKNIKPFIHGEIGWGNLKTKVNPMNGPDIESTDEIIFYELGGGIALFLNDKISIDLSVSYAYTSKMSTEDNYYKKRYIVDGFGSLIGISFYI